MNCTYSLIGPNGSGKSTLLRAIARLHPPIAGEVTVADGADLRTLSSRDLARRITLLGQHRTTPGGLSVREPVEFGHHPHRSRWGGRDPEGPAAVDRAMALTGLAAFASGRCRPCPAGRRSESAIIGAPYFVWLLYRSRLRPV
ncbi:MAG: ATP-binding cassette domain-containing protein [Actinophytocola sp.]|uniref:ATP-binding cassette domain-containing protein n=1 Tax=Actinophytocola sp. TaxID=1872138 RepID=UPI003D6C20A8